MLVVSRLDDPPNGKKLEAPGKSLMVIEGKNELDLPDLDMMMAMMVRGRNVLWCVAAVEVVAVNLRRIVYPRLLLVVKKSELFL